MLPTQKAPAQAGTGLFPTLTSVGYYAILGIEKVFATNGKAAGLSPRSLGKGGMPMSMYDFFAFLILLIALIISLKA